MFKRYTKPFNLSSELLAAIIAAYCSLGLSYTFWAKIYTFSKQISVNQYYFIINIALISILLNFILINWCIWNNTAKYISVVIVAICIISNYFSKYYSVNFDRSMLSNILATDLTEAKELLTVNLLLNYLKFGLLPNIIILNFVQINRTRWSILLKRKIILTIAIIILGTGIILHQFKHITSVVKQLPTVKYQLLPFSLMLSTIRHISIDNINHNFSQSTISPIDPTAYRSNHRVSKLPITVVMVVGETVRANNWGLSGYQRQTTPELYKLPIINFPYANSCGTNTEISLPCMFSPYGRNNYNFRKIKHTESILHLINKLNIRVTWIENQSGCKGVCTGLETLPGSNFDAEKKLCNRASNCLDEVLITGLKKSIANTNQDQIIILHQLGNHGPGYFKRSPKKFHIFSPMCYSNDLIDCSNSEIVNSYDNAILYTDHILSQMIIYLQQITTRNIFFIYVSDHGESLGENNIYLHGMPYTLAPVEQKRVPMLFWSSAQFPVNQKCLRHKALSPKSHDHLYHTLLGLFQIQSITYNKDYDLLNNCYLPSSIEQK